ASPRTDSIKGLAQSIAKPAYRRLLTAEPLLRRAVPILIIAFLATICVRAVVQVLDHRRQTLAETVGGIAATADLIAERIDRAAREDAGRRPQELLARIMPDWGTNAGRIVLISDGEGHIVAATPAVDGIAGKRLIDVLGPTQPLTTFGAGAGVLEIAPGNGAATLATV